VFLASHENWGEEIPTRCSQSTKQKAMSARMVFRPSLKKKPMTMMYVDVKWDQFEVNPNYHFSNGGVYVAYTMGVDDGPGGYFGVQLKRNDGRC